jgi:hypothetical protein
MAAVTEERKATASAVLRHPLRVKILTHVNQKPQSPKDFVERTTGMTARDGEEYARKLSHDSYHFRCLEKAGCIEVVETIPRRGSQEHIYAGLARAHHSDEEWAKLSQIERCRISTVTMQGLMAELEASMFAHTFDSRDDRWLAWTRGKFDERGWAEMKTTIAANFAELERIRVESEARLEEGVEKAIPVLFSMMGFEATELAR